nr:MAG TPA: minor tail protein [Caudoviricetes sp.]
MVRVGADFSAITKQSKKASGSIVTMISSVNRATGKLEGACAKMTGALRGLGSALGVAGLAVMAKEAADAYNEVQENNAALAQVMKNTMAASKAEYQSVLDLCSAQEKLGVVDGEVAKAGAVELSTYLGLSSSLKTLIPVMDDMLAQQYGLKATSENAVNIATMLGKVMNGQTGALSRYGYAFDEAQAAVLKYGDEAQRAAVLASVVEDSVGGMNEALAQTPSGRIRQVKFALDEVQESFGQAIMTIAQVFLPLIRAVAGILNTVAAAANRVAQAIANVFGVKTKSMADVTAGVGQIAADGSSAADAVESVGDAAESTAKKLGLMNWDKLNVLSKSAASAEADAGQAPLAGNYDINWSSADTNEAAESCAWLEKVLLRLKKTADKMNFAPLAESWGRLKESAAGLGRTLIDGLGWVYETVLEPLAVWFINDLAPALAEGLAAVIDTVDAVVKEIAPVWKAIYETIIKPLAAVLGQAVVELLRLLAPLGKVVAGVAGIVTAFLTLDFDKLQASLATVLKGASDLALGAVDLIKNAFDGLCDWLIKAFDGLFGGHLSNVIRIIKDQVGDVVKFVRDAVQVAFAAVGDVLNGICDLLGGVFTLDWERAWNGLLQIAKGVAKAIAGIFGTVLNVFIRALNRINFTIPDWVPLLGGKHFGFNIPEVQPPRLEKGGILRSAGLFMANENGVPEMVGTMGGHAAVANSGQIQEGISDAVLEALLGTGLVGMLRDLVRYARITAEKDFTLGQPSSAAGRWARQSMDAYDRVRG